MNYVEDGLAFSLFVAFVGYLWWLALSQAQWRFVQLPGMMAKAYLLSLAVCLPIVGVYAVFDTDASWFSLAALQRLIAAWLFIGTFIGIWLSVRSSRAKRVVTTPNSD